MWHYCALEPTVIAVGVHEEWAKALFRRPQYRGSLESCSVIASSGAVIDYVDTSSPSRAMLNSSMDTMVV